MKFILNGIEWSISERSDMQQSDEVGHIDYSTKQISIDKSISKDFKRKVIIHEIGHAIMDSYLLSNTGKYTEEEMVEFLALYADKAVSITDRYFEGKDR